jgi:glutathione S-transferase
VVLRYTLLEPPERRLPQAVEDYRAFYLGRLRLLDAHIAGREFLCDDRFTIADICVGYALYLGSLPMIGMGEAYSAPVRAYLARLVERPAFRRAAARGAPLQAG